MLDESHNDGSWKLTRKGLNDSLVYCRDCSSLETSGHCAQDRKDIVLGRAMVSVDEPTDHGVKKDDEGGSECRDEEERFGSVWHLSSSKITSTPYHVQHS